MPACRQKGNSQFFYINPFVADLKNQSFMLISSIPDFSGFCLLAFACLKLIIDILA
jgi:hypothetical protein